MRYLEVKIMKIDNTFILVVATSCRGRQKKKKNQKLKCAKISIH